MPYTDKTLMTFGKHKGKPLGEIPASYLDWLLGEEFVKINHRRLYDYLVENKDLIHEELDNEDHSDDQFSIYQGQT